MVPFYQTFFNESLISANCKYTEFFPFHFVLIEKCWNLATPSFTDGYVWVSLINSYMKYLLSTWDVPRKVLDFKAKTVDKRAEMLSFLKPLVEENWQ